MKKEIIISDIDFLKPDSDLLYSKNTIRNLLGNYYLIDKEQKYLLTRETIQNGELQQQEKYSLISDEKNVQVVANVANEKEIITLSFKLPESWNSLPQDAMEALIEQEQYYKDINNLEEFVNLSLASLYYYELSTTNNALPANATEEDILTKKYGPYFYDYSLIFSNPVAINLVGQKYINESLAAVSTAKIEPFYNYYDKDYENVASKNNEQQLFNYYSLYYYLQNILKKDKNSVFLNKNVFPLLRKYNSFIYNYLANNKTQEDIIKKLQEYKNNPSAINLSKKTIAILPDSLKVLNELNTKKAEQPYGIDISFAPQPKKTLGTLLSDSSNFSDIEKFVVYKDANNIINTKAFIAESFINNNDIPTIEKKDDIPIISLNKWINTLAPSIEVLDNDNTIVFTNGEKDKDSIFLQKIKKFLMQEKINELIKTKKRSYLDIISGASAYNEVLLYEIIKYNKNEPIQSILIPNTEEFDFYKYFDTQIKYDTTYGYEVRAWTLIIGNKYKYFDRIALPNVKAYALKNSTLEDSEYFRWFRVAHVMSKYLNVNDKDGVILFINNNPPIFASVAGGENGNFNANFSNTLFDSYKSLEAQYDIIKGSITLNSAKELAKKIIENVRKDFVLLMTNLLFGSTKSSGVDFTFGNFQYQTLKKPITDRPLDILGSSPSIDKNSTYYTDTFSFQAELDVVYEILKFFIKAGIFKSIDMEFILNIIQKYKNSNNFLADTFAKNDIFNYLKEKFIVDVDKFLDGGYKFVDVTPDLKQIENINFGLNKDDGYYPRFYTKKDNANNLVGQLQFGVHNEVDIILAGLPYVNKVTTKVVSSPPPPPDILVIPYKNVKNKIKFFVSDSFFTYRDYPIYMLPQDTVLFDSLLDNEKIKYPDDGKITFSGDEPSALFARYRLEEKPKLYSDFSKGEIGTFSKGGFEDTIEPNKKYYYTFRAVDNHFMVSNPSAIYEVEIIENSGAIYPIVKIVELYNEDNRTKTLSFKEALKLSVNQEHILENKEIKNASELGDLGKFGSLTPSIFGKKFKIRITSKSTKKKIDINLSFTKQADAKLLTSYLAKVIKKAKEIENKKKQVTNK